MENSEETLVIPSSLGGQFYGLLLVAALDGIPITLLRYSLLDRIQDFRIYSLPWWISVAVITVLAIFLTALVLLGAVQLICFGKTNAALVIDRNGIILPFTDSKSIIIWDNIENYERKDAPYQRNGASCFLYLTLRKADRTWANPFRKSKIQILGCFMSEDEKMDKAMALIEKYYVWK